MKCSRCGDEVDLKEFPWLFRAILKWAAKNSKTIHCARCNARNRNWY